MALRGDVVGPDPRGRLLEVLPTELTREQAWKEHVAIRQNDGEEILTKEVPTRRYGAGVLHPPEVRNSDVGEEPGDLGEEPSEDEDGYTEQDSGIIGEGQVNARKRGFDADGDDSGVTDTNGFKPSAMGLSFVLNLDRLGDDVVRVVVASRFRTDRRCWEQTACGFYREHKVRINDPGEARVSSHDSAWWLRAPLHLDGKAPEIRLTAGDLEAGSGQHQLPQVDGFAGRIALRWHVRRWPGAGESQRLVTLTLINESSRGDCALDAICLFQSGLVVDARLGAIDEYPRALLRTEEVVDPLDDERVSRIIYSRRAVKAVGHGCGVDWEDGAHGTSLWTDVMPAWEMAPMAFDVADADGNSLSLPMRAFAEMAEKDSPAFELLERLVSGYEHWIDGLRPDEFPDDKATAEALVGRCRKAAQRMRDGIDLLKGRDSNVLKAFALANRAMLMAQHRRSGEARQPQFGAASQKPTGWSVDYARLDLDDKPTVDLERRRERPVGHWRPFQLAFLLMSLDGIVHDMHCEDREVVDLIWFPTGGGKTEAYLGLTAFTVFYNVLSGRVNKKPGEPRAISILMRYTLRLLTAQQFERAVKLFCAMELIRKADTIGLGALPFTVGLWVGGTNTPNKIDHVSKDSPGAEQSKRGLEDSAARNPFVLLQCPWCGAKFGHVAKKVVHGYRIAGSGARATFEYACPDENCEFGDGSNLRIPAQVVDENLYREPPTLLIGTVDKFAMLAWNPEARSFFGISNEGKRVARGPTLIIQDEMHLMTGPLGTMVALFETAVDALCRYDEGFAPKIIASTATAARANEQIRGLYARDGMLFPPPGLDATDSFFARENPGNPGRLYVGVLAPGHGSMQTTQRNVYAALAQGAADLALEVHSKTAGDAKQKNKSAAEAADPWWTLLAYYNSLRELGGALTLFGADIPDQLGVLSKRRSTSRNDARRVYVDGRVLELTSRLDSGDVPHALRSLENELVEFEEKNGAFSVNAKSGPQDACLASNIIEVGVDVPRLSLMTIVGQPKTTAAYIQASSRVGRREDRPGLVVMLYSSTKPRDRSHYERFRAYHQAIYAWVEPASVTPFSPPVVDRALHAVMVSMIRQTVRSASRPRDVKDVEDVFNWVSTELKDRAGIVARPDEMDRVLSRFNQLCREWRAYNPEHWGKIVLKGNLSDNAALMIPAGRDKPPQWGRAGWATPTSLRAVDANCEAGITPHFAETEAAGDHVFSGAD